MTSANDRTLSRRSMQARGPDLEEENKQVSVVDCKVCSLRERTRAGNDLQRQWERSTSTGKGMHAVQSGPMTESAPAGVFHYERFTMATTTTTG